MLEFKRLQVLTNCFLMLNNTYSLTIFILLTIIIYRFVHKLDIVFDFPYLFLTFIARLV